MDGLNVDHLQSMTTQDGPFSWITSGKVDAVLDIKFPRDPSDELALSTILDELADVLTSVASPSIDRIPGQRELAKPPLSAPSDQVDEVEGAEDSRDGAQAQVDLALDGLVQHGCVVGDDWHMVAV